VRKKERKKEGKNRNEAKEGSKEGVYAVLRGNLLSSLVAIDNPPFSATEYQQFAQHIEIVEQIASEMYYLLGCGAVYMVERRNVLPPSSGYRCVPPKV
jgi:hypothetical protein